MGFWHIVGCVCGSALAATAVVGAIYVSYKIYQKMNEDPYSHGKSSKTHNSVGEIASYNDIKSKAEDSVRRRRNVSLNYDAHNSSNENLIAQEHRKLEQKTQTKCEQETQTFDLPELNNYNDNFSESRSLSSVTSDTETVCSFESALDDIDDIHCDVPTWDEMSDSEKQLCKCRACNYENPVETVTIPCNHPYLCKECAQILITYLKECVKDGCRKKVKGYAIID